MQFTKNRTDQAGYQVYRGLQRDAIRHWQGVAAWAIIMIPSALLPIEWERDTFSHPRGQFLPAFATKAVLAREEEIDERRCYKVVCEREIETWTLWVDTGVRSRPAVWAKRGPTTT